MANVQLGLHMHSLTNCPGAVPAIVSPCPYLDFLVGSQWEKIFLVLLGPDVSSWSSTQWEGEMGGELCKGRNGNGDCDRDVN